MLQKMDALKKSGKNIFFPMQKYAKFYQTFHRIHFLYIPNEKKNLYQNSFKQKYAIKAIARSSVFKKDWVFSNLHELNRK